MKEKLLAFMEREGLRPGQLADQLKINPAGISHILAGRNKPGFDLLQKILRRYPNINPDWLLLDSKQMYRNDDLPASTATHASASQPASSGDLFSRSQHPADGSIASGNATSASVTASTTEPIGANAPESPAFGRPVPSDFPSSRKPNVTVERVVIFYSDQTFESYIPTTR